MKRPFSLIYIMGNQQKNLKKKKNITFLVIFKGIKQFFFFNTINKFVGLSAKKVFQTSNFLQVEEILFRKKYRSNLRAVNDVNKFKKKLFGVNF